MIYLDKKKTIQTGHAGPRTLTRAQNTKLANVSIKNNSSQFTLK